MGKILGNCEGYLVIKKRGCYDRRVVKNVCRKQKREKGKDYEEKKCEIIEPDHGRYAAGGMFRRCGRKHIR